MTPCPAAHSLQDLHFLALCSWHCSYLLTGALHFDFGLLWSPIYPIGTQRWLVVPLARTAIKQRRAFSTVGHSAWNSLPSELISLPRDLSSSFYKFLKTFIFARACAVTPLSSYLEVALHKLSGDIAKIHRENRSLGTLVLVQLRLIN